MAILRFKRTTPAPPSQLHTHDGRLVNPDVNLDRNSELIAQADEEKYLSRR